MRMNSDHHHCGYYSLSILLMFSQLSIFSSVDIKRRQSLKTKAKPYYGIRSTTKLYPNAQQTTKNQIQRHQNKAQINTKLEEE